MARDPALDGMRGVAVAGVIAYHIDPYTISGGWAGVEMFFTLSGYLITSLLMREHGQTGRIDLRAFYRRRWARLTPALAVMLVGTIALCAVLGGDLWPVLRAAAFGAVYVTNWVLAYETYSAVPFGHTWSLAIEEQFYLLWPLCFLFLGRRRLPVTLLVAMSIVLGRAAYLAAGASVERAYNGFDLHADGLLFGCVLALAQPRLPRRLAGPAAAIALTGLVLLFVGASVPWHRKSLAVVPVLASGLTALLIMALRSDATGWVYRALAFRPVLFTGQISYSLYLWHAPILILSGQEAQGLSAIPMLAISYIIAAISYYGIERRELPAFLRLRSNRPAEASASD